MVQRWELFDSVADWSDASSPSAGPVVNDTIRYYRESHLIDYPIHIISYWYREKDDVRVFF